MGWTRHNKNESTWPKVFRVLMAVYKDLEEPKQTFEEYVNDWVQAKRQVGSVLDLNTALDDMRWIRMGVDPDVAREQARIRDLDPNWENRI